MTAPLAPALVDAYRRETRLARVLSHRPVVAWVVAGAVTAAWIGAHALVALLRDRGVEAVDYRAVLVFGEANGTLMRAGAWWRPVSAMWLHVSSMHLVLNVGAMLAVTPLCERVVGRWRTVVIFGLGGVAGAALSAMVRGDSTVGASPAIVATLAAVGVAALRHREAMPARLVRALVGTWVMLTIVGVAAGLVDDTIDGISHAGGWVVGAALGAVLPTSVSDERPERASRVIGLGFAALAVFGLVMMVSEAARCGGSETAFMACYAAIVSVP